MICEHKRESRSTASSSLDPVAAPGTCPESSWLASLPSPISHPPSTRLHWATASVFTTTRSLCALRPSRGRQSVEPLLTSVECLPPHSFTHDSRQTPPELGVSLSPSLPLSPCISLPFCCPFFNCICRDFTARCAFDSRTEIPHSLHPTFLPFPA